jgi:hypothetical protein
VQSCRAELEACVNDRIAALTQNVQRAEAAVQRLTEHDARADVTAQALDARLAQAADERANEVQESIAAKVSGLEANLRAAAEDQTRALEATGTAMRNDLRDRLRANTSVAQSTDTRTTELAEIISAAQDALEQVVARVEALEGIAGALTDRLEQQAHSDLAAAPQESGRSEAAADGADGAARRGPKREPRDTPDLR